MTSPFYARLAAAVAEQGGFFNAHLHLDRAGTFDDAYLQRDPVSLTGDSHISLHRKHSLISGIHSGLAYTEDDLRRRVNETLDQMVAVNTRRADTMVDVCADNVGLAALELLEDIRAQRAGEIELRLAAYSPFGFSDAEPQRWEIFAQGAARADFIGALPEADDTAEYPDHIGFMEHCRRTLELAGELGKMLHVHTDQRNEAGENGTEQLVTAVRRYGAPVSADGEPMVWAVHMISPSMYDEARFQRLVEGLLECNIGVICCPSAAIGMRQLRPLQSPTYNSIPRVLELVAAGVPVRLASDNIADICSPSTTADLTDEVFMLSAALRFYQVDILARLAAGVALSEAQIQRVRDHLQRNDEEVARVLGGRH